MRKTLMVAVFSAVVGALVAVPVAVYAAHSFNDVPSTNTFHSDIAWLKDSGVTKGCNPPANTQYCPDDNVTRGQMAAFMHRLAENQVVDAATAVSAESAIEADNADTVDGFEASDLASRAAFATSTNLPDESASLETTIVAPAAGTLVMSASADAGVGTVDGIDDQLICWLQVDGNTVDGSWMDLSVPASDPINADTFCSTDGVEIVPAGTYTVTFELIEVDQSDWQFGAGSMSVIWVPLDGEGNIPNS